MHNEEVNSRSASTFSPASSLQWVIKPSQAICSQQVAKSRSTAKPKAKATPSCRESQLVANNGRGDKWQVAITLTVSQALPPFPLHLLLLLRAKYAQADPIRIEARSQQTLDFNSFKRIGFNRRSNNSAYSILSLLPYLEQAHTHTHSECWGDSTLGETKEEFKEKG